MIIQKAFEHNALGIISDERFVSMSKGFEAEQQEVRKQSESLRNQLEQQQSEMNNFHRFLEILRKYTDVKELTQPMLNELIEKIVVHNAEGKGMRKNRVQKVEIFYRFIGDAQFS